MKTKKKDAKNFQKLDVGQMRKINGGTFIEFRNPDGTIVIIEV